MIAKNHLWIRSKLYLLLPLENLLHIFYHATNDLFFNLIWVIILKRHRVYSKMLKDDEKCSSTKILVIRCLNSLDKRSRCPSAVIWGMYFLWSYTLMAESSFLCSNSDTCYENSILIWNNEIFQNNCENGFIVIWRFCLLFFIKIIYLESLEMRANVYFIWKWCWQFCSDKNRFSYTHMGQNKLSRCFKFFCVGFWWSMCLWNFQCFCITWFRINDWSKEI